MGILSGGRAMGAIWSTIREINLGEIKSSAEQRFSLLLLGEPAATEALAVVLSQRPGATGIHPWLGVEDVPLPAEGLPYRPDLALLVVTAPDLEPAADEALRQLHHLGVPVVTVVVGETAAARVGAEIPRATEHSRVLLPAVADAEAVGRRLLPAMLTAASQRPGLDLALGRQLPLLRDPIIARLVEETSRANATVALTTGLGEMVPGLTLPMIVGDSLILTKNQLVMAYRITLVAGRQGDPHVVMGEILSVIGGGLLFRQVARELVGLIPVIGIVSKVAVAYAGTRAIGLTVELWAQQHRRPSRAEVRQIYAQSMERGKQLANQLLTRARRDRTKAKLLPPPPGR